VIPLECQGVDERVDGLEQRGVAQAGGVGAKAYVGPWVERLVCSCGGPAKSA
jgi:hypothetical protein